jgi:TolB-like protein/class 3 adenylate cyclase/Flp pilus assembly protein TadD
VTPESGNNLRLEIGHVLFIDLVGYSKLLIEEQKERLRQLTDIVLATAQVREATNEQLIRLPTGDGMALVFRNSAEEPALCALEITQALKTHPEIAVRMGIHSGPVSEVTDVSGRTNITGGGINMAQRVMDCGDAGHILLSKHVANDLQEHRQWSSSLHDLGECEVKHGMRMSIVNLHADQVGNPQLPKRFQALKKHRARMRSAGAAAALLALAVIVAGIAMFSRNRVRSPLAAPEKSIAVLPFENLSSEKENAYFADGIEDEILTRLSKIADLKVISRTSTQHYKSAPENLPEIAKQLGVAHILEGSVQKSGDAVRVNVQLIKAANDSHLWADTFDRKLTDIFSVESEVAKAIAEQLRAKLTGQEEQAIAAKPTSNPEAYDAYLRGLALEPRGWYSAEAKETLRRSYAEAVRLDPKFVAAWARLARIDSLMVFLGTDATQERRDAARHALDTAIKLQSDSTDTLLAQGYYDYWVLRDYPKAKDLFAQVRNRLPNSGEVPSALALVARRQGLWDESLNYSDQALTFDPRNPQLLADRAWTYAIIRRFDDALKTSDRLLKISPTDPDATAYRAAIFHAQGKLDEAQQLLSGLHPDFANDSVTEILIQHWLFNRDYSKLIETLQPALTDLGITATGRALYREAIGFAQLRSGDKAAANQTLLQARSDLELLKQRDANNPELVAHLGAVNAYLGEKETALRLAENAVALLPASQDAVIGPALEEDLARVEAEVGENDRAIARLQKLLKTPYSSVSHTGPITPALLRLHPSWDPLRGDPRFEKLIAPFAPGEAK